MVEAFMPFHLTNKTTTQYQSQWHFRNNHLTLLVSPLKRKNAENNNQRFDTYTFLSHSRSLISPLHRLSFPRGVPKSQIR
ncbi:hypothetical protein L1887_27483 [Cichorium endivia]|nr:hypothetical protein L1887_27483 [Cichorium endivia]